MWLSASNAIPPGHRPVPDDREDRLVGAARIARERRAQRHRERIRRVPAVECVVDRLAALGEAAHPAVLPKCPEALATPGEQLVHVALMPHIEEDPVRGTVQSPMNAEGELNDAQVGRQMAAGLGDGGHKFIADLRSERLKLRLIERLEVAGRLDAIQDALRVHARSHLRMVVRRPRTRAVQPE